LAFFRPRATKPETPDRPSFPDLPITLTLAFDEIGFTASTDVGNYSSGRRLWSSLTNGFSPKDLGTEVFTYLQYYDSNESGKVDWFTVVPEPSTRALLGMSMIGLLACAWRRREIFSKIRV
jgi:hypothetical protein